MTPELIQLERTLDKILSPSYAVLNIFQRQPLIAEFERQLFVLWSKIHAADLERLVPKIIAATVEIADVWPTCVMRFLYENGADEIVRQFLEENPDWEQSVVCSCGRIHIVRRDRAKLTQYDLHLMLACESILHYGRIIAEEDAGLEGMLPR